VKRSIALGATLLLLLTGCASATAQPATDPSGNYVSGPPAV
jgi:hypothetical protein